jgi:hypothetical protein
MARHPLAKSGRRTVVRPAWGLPRPERVGRNQSRRREEWQQQTVLAALLDRWLPADAFWNATDPVAASATGGARRKLRGVKPEFLTGSVSPESDHARTEITAWRGQSGQRIAREGLPHAGAEWWEWRSANAAMWALVESGVEFHEIVSADGKVERWQQPELAP